MPTEQDDFYQKLRLKFKDWSGSHKWAEYLMCAPDLFHLLCKLSLDKEVPSSEKLKLGAAITYFISPIDFLPEALLGPVGYMDDIALAAFVLNSIVNNTNEELLLKHWAGERDILELIRQILAVADKMVGSGLWRKLKKLI